MINFKSKKADLTANQIITIIILIVSFAVILLFFFMLNLKGNIDAESCRNSVVMRSSLLGGTATVQLQCKTQEVCIYKSGDCANMGKDAIKIKVASKDELLDALGDRIYNCHWQMGEGKMDFLPPNFGFTSNYCAICDTIYFDEGIKNDDTLNKIPVRDLYTFLKVKKAPDGVNSLLFNMYGVNSLDSISVQDKSGQKVDLLSQTYDFSRKEGYVLVTSMAKSGWGGTLLAATGGVVVGALAIGLSPVTAGTSLAAGAAIITGAGLVGGGITGGVGFYVSGPGDTVYMPPSLYLNTAKIVDEQIKCNDFTTLA